MENQNASKLEAVLNITITAKNKLEFLQHIQSIAHEKGYDIVLSNDTATIALCRYGTLFVQFSKLWRLPRPSLFKAQLTTNTLQAGAGFHAAVINFCECVAGAISGTITITDSSGYSQSRDFAALQKYYYTILRSCGQEFSVKNLQNHYLFWENSYIPKDLQGTVVTQMGRLDTAKLLARIKSGIKCCENIFIWHNRDKDAIFYRNCALSILWQDSRFLGGENSSEDFEANQMAIEFLQKSLNISRDIPFPVQDYVELCKLNLIHPQNTEGLEQFSGDYLPCYRLDFIRVRHGAISFKIHGCFLYSFDDDDIADVYTIETPKSWCTLRVATLVKLENEEEFRTGAFDGAEEEAYFFQSGDISGKAAFLGSVIEEGEEYFQLVAQVNFGAQKTLFTFSFSNTALYNWPEDVLRSIGQAEENIKITEIAL